MSWKRWRVVRGFAWIGVLLGCGRSEPTARFTSSSTAPAPAPASASASPSASLSGGSTSAAGPRIVAPSAELQRRYVLANTGGHCAVYIEHHGQRLAACDVPCPRDLRSGERIRLAGKVCFREGGLPERSLPVSCPKHVVALERADRLDAGLEP